MIPQTFNDWTNCIVNACKINPTTDFAEKRLAVYKDHKNAETQKFISLYDEQHHSNIINWLEKIKNNESY
ncbi:MAG: hypothetical protein K2Q03_00370 [Sphingobacteriaceae bacterium]|nr:hypothetical protein [Sphingobacteriaceae bacterium]